MNSKRHSSGFSLLELLVALVVVATIATTTSGLVSVYQIYQEASYIETATDVNRRLGKALQQWAANENNGRLPAVYTGGGFTSSVADPTNATLMGYISNAGVHLDMINDDGFASRRVRTYQPIALSRTVPLFGNTGDTVVLNYDHAVIYQTKCPLADATCNPSATGIPGDSVVLTAANVNTWNVGGDDVRPYPFNTYGIQLGWMETTRGRLESIRDALRASFLNQLQAAAPGTTTNFYLLPTGAGAPAPVVADPATNQDCHDQWYQLDAANVNILNQLNISPVSTMATTPWGGRIEYCPDYDPAGLGANAQPHGAALRINRTLSSGSAPSAVAANNFVLGF